jgi:hypothetical protein
MPLDVHSGLTKQQLSPEQRASDTLRQNTEGAAFVNDDPKSVLRTFGHFTPDSHTPFAKIPQVAFRACCRLQNYGQCGSDRITNGMPPPFIVTAADHPISIAPRIGPDKRACVDQQIDSLFANGPESGFEDIGTQTTVSNIPLPPNRLVGTDPYIAMKSGLLPACRPSGHQLRVTQYGMRQFSARSSKQSIGLDTISH